VRFLSPDALFSMTGITILLRVNILYSYHLFNKGSDETFINLFRISRGLLNLKAKKEIALFFLIGKFLMKKLFNKLLPEAFTEHLISPQTSRMN